MHKPDAEAYFESHRPCTSVDARAHMRLAGLCYNSFAMPSTTTINTFLVPEKTVASAKGDGPTLDIGGAASRVLLLTVDITAIIEQRASDVSIYGAADAAAGGAKALPAVPPKSERGQHTTLPDPAEDADLTYVEAPAVCSSRGRAADTPGR